MSVSDLRRFVHAVAAAGGLICLSACGGGGGGGGGASPNPLLGATTFSTNENVPLNGTLSATDPSGSPVTFAMSAGSPKSGAVSGFTAAGQFVYTPNRNFTGSDSFSVTATDAAGHATTGTISITVTVNQPPVVNADTVLRADPDASGTSIVNVLKQCH